MLFVQTTKTMTTTTTTTTTASICHRMIAHHNSRFLSSTSLSSQSNSIVPRLLARHRRLSLQQHQRQRQPSLIGIRQYHHAMMSTRSNLCRRMGISAYYAQRSLFTVSIGIGCAWWMSPSSLSSLSSDCEAIMVVADDNNNDDAFVIATSGVRMIDDDTTEGINNNDDERTTLLSRIKRALKMIRRILKLTIVFSPVVVLYPLHLLTWRIFVGNNDENNNKVTDDAHDLALNSISFNDSSSLKSIGWYYRLCLHCVEYSGAACIKIMQWAGSRPDMFGHNFCAVFSKLQDSTKPHSWQYTKRAMKDAYGENWEEKIKLDQNDILGSGCIGQVYKGVIFDDDDDDDDDGVGVGVGVDSDINERKNGKVNNNVNNVNVVNSNKEVKKNKKKERPVAVKIMHPHVEKDIDADLDILRLTVHALEHMNIGPVKNLKWLNLPGFIEEMAIMLKIQLDLRTEGEHLIQFNKNFGCDGDENNKKYQSIVFPKLIHEYPPTKHVLMETFCEGQPVMDFIRTNKADQKLLTTMCTEAIKAVCQMIFIDNFTHGDLHPGNVLVTEDLKFVILDVGITTVHSESDHRLISDVLAAFIRCDGRKAGRSMIDDSNTRLESIGDHSIDAEKFIDKMEQLTIKAQGENYFMEHLGTYISHICQCAATHHVMINQAFISAALAVKVQEGIALALDPSIEIWKIAIPVIMEGERKHGRAAERAKEILGFDRFVGWLTGNKNDVDGKDKAKDH